MTSNVEKINAKKQIILERKKYEVEDTKLHDSLISLKEEELNLNNTIDNYKNEILIKEEENKNLNSDIDDFESKIIKIKSDKDDSLFNLNTLIKNINILKAKIDTLTDNIENNNTLPYSVKEVLNNPKLRGIHNVIASLIEIDEDYTKAISVTLGANSSTVVVDNEVCAKEAINYLKNNNKGRVTFFPLNIIKEKVISKDVLNLISKEKGFIDIASNLVKYQDKYDNIIKNQLGNVIVVDNIDTANIISKKIDYKYRVVTIDGEILHVGGSLTGGTIKVRNVITDKYELENSIKELEKLENKQKDIENELNKLDYDFKALEDKLYLINKEKINNNEYIEFRKNNILSINNKLEEIRNGISGINNSLNNTIDKEEELVLEEYYKAIDEKNKIETELELLSNKKIDIYFYLLMIIVNF